MSPPPTSNTQSQPIEIFFDILDYIFTFLRFDSESLLACSKAHPGFFSIAGRHLYRHIIISTSPDFETTDHGYCLEPSDLIELLSETPQIVNHVRVLQIAFCKDFDVDGPETPESRSYEEIALILPLFTALEIILLTGYSVLWEKAPRTLKTAVEDSLSLPTLHEVHIKSMHFPLCLLNNNTNITRLRLSGSPQMPDYPNDADTYLQLKSLIVEDINHPSECGFAWNWAKRRITKLQSLQCDLNHSGENLIREALEICSGTLNELNLGMKSSSYYTAYDLNTGEVEYSSSPMSPIKLSSLPHLQHLTLCVDAVYCDGDVDDTDSNVQEFCITCLPSAVEILKTAPPLQHITIEIRVRETRVWHNFDFSSLAALAEFRSFPHIDLYITNTTYTEIVSKLAQYESLKKWIEQRVLIIHAKETRNSQFVYYQRKYDWVLM